MLLRKGPRLQEVAVAIAGGARLGPYLGESAQLECVDLFHFSRLAVLLPDSVIHALHSIGHLNQLVIARSARFLRLLVSIPLLLVELSLITVVSSDDAIDRCLSPVFLAVNEFLRGQTDWLLVNYAEMDPGVVVLAEVIDLGGGGAVVF